MISEEQTFTDVDGVEVFYRRWLPEGEPSKVVLVAHGMSEHSARYRRLAEHLTGPGFAVYALDHRGHGRTANSTGTGKAGATGMAGIIGDLDQLADLAAKAHPSAPLVLFGHSMGSMISNAYIETHGDRLTGVVLSGSPGVDDSLAEMAAGLKEAVDGGMGDEPIPALAGFNEAFEPARTPYDWLSRDEAEVDAYIADPMCGDEVPMTFGFLAGLLSMAADATSPAGIGKIPSKLPVLLLTGEADPVSNAAATVRVFEQRLREAGLQVEAKYYPDARHEILNETNRSEVYADLLAWLAGLPT